MPIWKSDTEELFRKIIDSIPEYQKLPRISLVKKILNIINRKSAGQSRIWYQKTMYPPHFMNVVNGKGTFQQWYNEDNKEENFGDREAL